MQSLLLFSLLQLSSLLPLGLRTAIAPVPTGKHVEPAVQRAFQSELERGLGEIGSLVAPNEVDMRVADRPDLIRCATGACLAEEAKLLSVERVVVPRLEPLHDPGMAGVEVGLALYDAAAGRMVATSLARCAPCGAEAIRVTVREAIAALQAALNRGPAPTGDSQSATVSKRPERRAPRFRVVKWVALAAGIAAAAIGAGLWAVDGQGTCALAPGQVECQKVYDTLPVGAGLVGAGGLAVLTSVVMIGLDARF